MHNSVNSFIINAYIFTTFFFSCSILHQVTELSHFEEEAIDCKLVLVTNSKADCVLEEGLITWKEERDEIIKVRKERERDNDKSRVI